MRYRITILTQFLRPWTRPSWNKAKAAHLLRIDRVNLYRKIKRHNPTKDTPDVEVLHVTQKSCNASVACNTHFPVSYRSEPNQLRLKLQLHHDNMG